MESQDIKDVLALRDILAEGGSVPEVISALIAWRDGTLGMVETVAEPVAQQDHSVAEEAVARAEKAAPKPAKAAPAKAAAKGRAKPPPPPADDDDDTKEPLPDPSDDDADF
jgi:hypothetical protein